MNSVVMNVSQHTVYVFRVMSAVAVLFTLFLLLLMPCLVHAEVLEGQVEKNGQLFRIAPPSSQMPSSAPDFRLQSPLSGQAGLSGNVVDTTAFGPPLTGNVNAAGANGVVQSGQFAAPAPRNFDLGADAGSRELVLAWDRWHQQLSKVIYERWTQRADMPGFATVRVTVTRDHQIHADVLESHGRPDFIAGLLDAIDGINGNPGLTFPVGSQRQNVSFDADYIAGHNVTPGYSWVHNDYEVIHQNY